MGVSRRVIHGIVPLLCSSFLNVEAKNGNTGKFVHFVRTRMIIADSNVFVLYCINEFLNMLSHPLDPWKKPVCLLRRLQYTMKIEID